MKLKISFTFVKEILALKHSLICHLGCFTWHLNLSTDNQLLLFSFGMWSHPLLSEPLLCFMSHSGVQVSVNSNKSDLLSPLWGTSRQEREERRRTSSSAASTWRKWERRRKNEFISVHSSFTQRSNPWRCINPTEGGKNAAVSKQAHLPYVDLLLM